MAANSKIEWTDHTFNPWIGCSKVSEGCKHCYAETLMDKRYGKVQWGPKGTRVKTSPANWREPIKWNKSAEASGSRHRVFCASLADVFEDRGELVHWRYVLLNLIDRTPNLDWLLLTKRPENVERLVAQAARWPSILQGDDAATTRRVFDSLPNVWLGTSIENQETADKRIPELLKVPAAVRFLSIEPLLGPVDLTHIQHDRIVELNALTGDHGVLRPHRGRSDQTIDWVIVGGESGPGARPMHPDWVRSIRDQCQAAGVPFFFKQWGEWAPDENDGTHWFESREDGEFFELGKDYFAMNKGVMMRKAGKKSAGRLLDGRTWDEFPSTDGVRAGEGEGGN